MTITERITEVIDAHLPLPDSDDVCECGFWSGEVSYAEHVAAAVADMLEVWLPPLFASAIHAYADSELQAYGYGEGKATEALKTLNNNAAHIAAYALTSSKWRAAGSNQ